MTTETAPRRFHAPFHGVLTRKSGATFGDDDSTSGTRTDTVTKGENYTNWKQRIKNGSQCTTTLSGRKYRARYSHVVATGQFKFNPGQSGANNTVVAGFYSGVIPLLPRTAPFTVSNASSVDDSAKVKFVRACNRERRSFQGGVFLGELTEALHLIRSPARTFRKGLDAYLTDLKKGRGKLKGLAGSEKIRIANKIVSDTWLEHSFGWAPLLNDVDDGIETLGKHLWGADAPKTKFVSASAKTEHYLGSGSAGLVGGNNLNFKLTNVYTTTYSVRYYGKLRVFHPTKITPRRIGLSLNDVIPTAWELVPWSFLVDYFTNVGDIIESAAALESDVRWMARTERLETVNRPTISHQAYSSFLGHWVGSAYGGTGTELSVADVERAPFVGSLIPSLRFNLPGFSRQWINMGALFASARASRML